MKKIVVIITTILCCSCGTSYKAQMLANENETIELQAKLQDNFNIYNTINEEIEVLKDSLDAIKSSLKNFEEEYQKGYRNGLIQKQKELKTKINFQVDSIVKAANAKYENSLTNEQKRLKKILTNVEYSLDYPNSAGGCDFNFTAKNTSSKTIKYLYINISGFKNAVDDYVSCDIRGSKNFCAKDTGPCPTNCTIGGTWGTVIYNYSARKAIISNVKIIYMDNSSIVLTAKNLKDIMSTPEKPYINIDLTTGDLMKKYGYSKLSAEIEKGYTDEWRNTDTYKKYKEQISSIEQKISSKEECRNMINASIANIKIRMKELNDMFKSPDIDEATNYIG